MVFEPQEPAIFQVQHSSDGKKMLRYVFDHEAIWGDVYSQLVGKCRILTCENSLRKLDLEIYNTKPITFPCKNVHFIKIKILHIPIILNCSAVQYKRRTVEEGRYILCLSCCHQNMEETLESQPFLKKQHQNVFLKCGFQTLHKKLYYGEGKDGKVLLLCFVLAIKLQTQSGR